MQDNKTNRVFFSACLTEGYRSCAKAIKDALRENGIVVEKKIRNTKDIWARDYMPIQIGENKFMRYMYRPIIFGKSRATDNILQTMLNVIFLQVRKL